MKNGFDSEMYMQKQKEQILKRISQFGKLYLEFGGKLFDDLHAARVLPGFDKAAKIKLLTSLKDESELIICISAGDIERNKIRADYGITYGTEVARMIDNISKLGISINSVVITMFENQQAAIAYKNKLENRGIKVFLHRKTEGYPHDVDTIVSDNGYGANPYIPTTKPLVVVSAPGPGSGKLATCLSQVYHENKRGVGASYAKFETFPIWNIPLLHPVNLAYEAATADLQDINKVDTFHFDAYGKMAVNYNRDIEAFPVVKAILNKISPDSDIYKSPTDMGVNMAGYCIYDDEAVQFAAKQEIIRRYLKGWVDFKNGLADEKTIHRLEFLMSKLSLKVEDRAVVVAAREKEEKTGKGAMAIELPDGRMIRGKGSDNMCAAASCVFNAVKVLADIPKSEKLISPEVIAPINKLKKNTLKDKDKALNLEEALLALAICASSDETAKKALEQLKNLNGCQAHSTFILKEVDEEALRKLEINVTSDAKFLSNDLIQ
ncbi:MAG: DUF1846 domain-containing protein [Acidaminococcus sp.]|nr:DUF1846 domain-containing protein [Acidaminococcus sp.]MDY4559871.1 DUF1846 domain-containing protein [Eubacteriales bacterium]MDY5345138.1 DUF1846 domain-containing protein [Eubacteriales bacterium]